MESLLITGAGPNGVTGRLIKEFFQNKYHVLTPGSKDLDLTDDVAVSNFFESNHIDYIIHCATFRNSSCNADNFVNEELESNLRMFYALAAQCHKVKKMIYFGSGAEFDKSVEIVNAQESDFGKSIPKNKYGLAKYIMNHYASTSFNIYNFRLFGTINQYERYNKNIISNLCVKALKGLPFKLQQDCRFSFIDINDILPILDHALSNILRYHDYNVAMNESYLLSEIALMISSISGIDRTISFMKDGMNHEYTASNKRLITEFEPHLTPIRDSIKRVYDHYSTISHNLNVDDIDERWNNRQQ